MRRALPLTLSATASLVLTGLLPSASAGSGDDATLLSDTNSARSQHGLSGYAVAADLAAAAQRHAQRMAARGAIYHDPDLGGSVCCWQDLGDNVGAGPDATSVHDAFMASSEHRANILSATYTQVGIGSARGGDGRLYVDEIFRRPSGAAPPQAAPVSTVPQQRSAPAVASRSTQRVPTEAEVLASRLDWLSVHYPPLPGQYDPVRQSLRFDAVMSRLSADPAS